MRARRALLYMPGDDMRKIRKAAALGVDCVCLDMEDGVAQNRKAQARQTIVEALGSLDFGRSERLARINPVGSGLEQDDLDAVLKAGVEAVLEVGKTSRPDGIVVPKVEHADQVRWVCDQIDRAEGSSTVKVGGIGVIALVETARGIVNLAQIASAHPRLRALIFGAEDLAGDMGAVRTPEAWEVFYARSAVVTHAAAFDLQAIDMVFIDFHDIEGLRQEAVRGAQMGFAGKQVIHPNQVQPVQEAFTPSDAEVEYAVRVMQAFEEHQQAGRGAFALEGKMIDAPILKAAQRVLARAQAAGKTLAGSK